MKWASLMNLSSLLMVTTDMAVSKFVPKHHMRKPSWLPVEKGQRSPRLFRTNGRCFVAHNHNVVERVHHKTFLIFIVNSWKSNLCAVYLDFLLICTGFCVLPLSTVSVRIPAVFANLFFDTHKVLSNICVNFLSANQVTVSEMAALCSLKVNSR